MSKSVLSMSMSLDGFIAAPNDGPGNGLGDNGHRLHAWFLPDADASRRKSTAHLADASREVMNEALSTGAVVVGRRTFELADGWGGDHLPPDHVELELLRALDGADVLHLRYRVRSEG